MAFTVSKEELFSEFKKYLTWETRSFDGWEAIEVFVGSSLSEAWVCARPGDAYRFEDPSYREWVDKASGKWLEKEFEEDIYKVILSTRHCRTLQDITKTLVHEMRHCLDYQHAVKYLPFEDFCPGNQYYNNWSEFRAVYAHCRYEFFSRFKTENGAWDNFLTLAEILGRETADNVEGIINAKGNMKEIMYYISRYIGASRAVRDLNIQTETNAAAYHIWNLLPQYIFENFGNVFYLGNEWAQMETCALSAEPQARAYTDLMEKVRMQTKTQTG